MKGVIDSISKDFTRIAGWVVTSDDNPKFIAEHQGIKIGEARLKPAYTSLTDSYGEGAKVYEITLELPLGALEVALHGLSVKVTEKDGSVGHLLPTRAFQNTVLNQAKKQLLRLDESKRTVLLSALGATPPSVLGFFDNNSLAPLYFPTGLSSNDTILGKNGYIFYTGSDHSLLDRYSGEQARNHAKLKAKGWDQKIAERSKRAAETGAEFRQLILPDKLTILGDYSHRETTGPSVYLEEFHALLGTSRWVIDPTEHFLRYPSREILWPATDSHTSSIAISEVIKLLFSSLGLSTESMNRVEFDQTRIHRGDIGGRFFGFKPAESIRQPGNDAFIGSDPQMSLLRKPDKLGSETGIHIRYENPSAITDKTIVLFGGSSSSQGHDPMNLSWWLKHYFARFDFVFSRSIDWALVEDRQPDFVIAQTIERYLPQVPDE